MTGTFDLTREPWVMVSDPDGARRELSIRQVFEQAPDLAAVVGDLPIQAAAVFRLHLAIAYRAVAREQSDEAAIDEWAEWWSAGTLPIDRIMSYLDQHLDRFDLFDSSAPFMQVAGLHTQSGSTSGLAKLIAEVPDGEQHFTTRAGDAVERISPAEAARWLVSLQAYDYSGIKTGAAGDPRVKGGRGYPIGEAWTGRLGLVIVEGRNLAESLLLNLHHGKGSPRTDTPVWEGPPHTAAPEGADAGPVDPSRSPRGVVDLLTWQARRVRLIREGGEVVDAIVANGDRVIPRNRHNIEMATAYRRSDAQAKKHGGTVYMPLTHPPQQSLWRGLAPLLSEQYAAAGEEPARLRPPILEWIGQLEDAGVLPADHPVRLHAVGVEYGSNVSSIAGITDDVLAFRLAVLSEPLVMDAVVSAVQATHLGVRALQDLASNLALAAGGEAEGPKLRAAEVGYALLDGPFRRWVATLDLDDVDAKVDAWHAMARAVLRQAADELLAEVGPSAVRGRVVARGQGAARLLDAGLADVYFRASLLRALDRGLPARTDDQARLAGSSSEGST